MCHPIYLIMLLVCSKAAAEEGSERLIAALVKGSKFGLYADLQVSFWQRQLSLRCDLAGLILLIGMDRCT